MGQRAIIIPWLINWFKESVQLKINVRGIETKIINTAANFLKILLLHILDFVPNSITYLPNSYLEKKNNIIWTKPSILHICTKGLEAIHVSRIKEHFLFMKVTLTHVHISPLIIIRAARVFFYANFNTFSCVLALITSQELKGFMIRWRCHQVFVKRTKFWHCSDWYLFISNLKDFSHFAKCTILVWALHVSLKID